MMLFASFIASAALGNCASTSVQAELNECASAELERADAQLNREWRIVFPKIQNRSKVDAEKLHVSQRAWIKQRDSKCDSEFPWDIGVSLDKMLNLNCRTEMTLERLRTLSVLAKGG